MSQSQNMQLAEVERLARLQHDEWREFRHITAGLADVPKWEALDEYQQNAYRHIAMAIIRDRAQQLNTGHGYHVGQK